jgi:hypothetical protein
MSGRLKSAFYAFLVFAVVMSAVFTITTGNLAVGIVTGIVAGALFALALLLFVVIVQKFRMFGVKNIQGWAADEVTIRSGAANFMRHGLAEGGILFLTDKRLRFCTHRVSAEVGDYSFPVTAIAGVKPFRTLGIVPNGIEVDLNDGRWARFVVEDRKGWMEAIERQRSLA